MALPRVQSRIPPRTPSLYGPVESPHDLGSSWPAVVAALGRDPRYVREFGRIYTAGIQPETIRDALATFERSLVGTGSRRHT